MRRITIASLICLLAIVATPVLYKMRAGTTPPVLDQKGRQLPGSIASLEKVELGGMEKWVLIRGAVAIDRKILQSVGCTSCQTTGGIRKLCPYTLHGRSEKVKPEIDTGNK